MIPVVFSEVRVTSMSDTPVLVLREATGERLLPIWITATAANAILAAMEGVEPGHPDIHDLFVETLEALDHSVDEVRIVGLEEGTFDAQIVVGAEVIAARASDAVALALRCDAPILVAQAVMDAGARPAEGSAAPTAASDEQVAEFRAFLDTINPEDFEPGAGGP